MSEASESVAWLVVGGGIHGVHLAVRLIAQAGVSSQQVTLVDPGEQLLDVWRRCTANTGMTHLRSPAVHHLGLKPFELLAFSGANRRGKGAEKGDFQAPYARPSVALFQAHCDALIERYGICERHVQDRVTQVEPGCDIVSVQLESGRTLHARHVVLALGASEQPRWPAWAADLKQQGAAIQQLFEPGFALRPTEWPERVAVFGGGISAVQAALRFVESGRDVSLVTRHPFRKHQFDSDPGWVGPKNMRAFSTVGDLTKRRALIQQARHKGSVPPKLYRAVRHAIADGRIHHVLADVQPTVVDGALHIETEDQNIVVDAVLLATGFESRRPGGPMVDALVQTHELPCAECGYPVVDAHLRWHPRVFVTGPLAELELGPVSRNIIGARRAAERILPLISAP